MSIFSNSSTGADAGHQENHQPLRIVEHNEGIWKVALNIPADELVDQKALLIHLRKVKRAIALEYQVTEGDLYFDGISDRAAADEAVDVIVNIRQQAQRCGSPCVHFREGMRGQRSFPKMVALLDIPHRDEDNLPVSMDRVWDIVLKSGIAASLLDKNLIEQKVAEVRKSQASIVNLIIARGKLPGSCADAELKLMFPAVPSPVNTADYISRRRVSAGNIICTKIPPQKNLEDGFDVLGNTLPCLQGLDIELQTGFGVHLSPSGNEVIAEIDGRGAVSFRYRNAHLDGGTQELPERALFKVNPVLAMDGNNVVNVCTSQAVQINGDLQTGSRIVTEGDVYISGNIAENSTVEAMDDIVIAGGVRDAKLTSESNVILMGDVQKGKVTARGQIIAHGPVCHSTLAADSISLGHIVGSDITARRSVTLRSVDPDESAVISRICVGISDYIQQRIIDSRKFIKTTTATLERLELLFGRKIVVQCDRANVQSLFLRYLTQIRASKNEQWRQAEKYRELLETIPPMKTLLRTKQEELNDMLHRVISSSDISAALTIEDKLGSATHISVDGLETVMPEGTGPGVIRRNDSQLAVTPQ